MVNIQHVLNAYASHYLRVDADGKVSAFNGYNFIPVNLVVEVYNLDDDMPVPAMEETPVETPSADPAGEV